MCKKNNLDVLLYLANPLVSTNTGNKLQKTLEYFSLLFRNEPHQLSWNNRLSEKPSRKLH